MPSSVRESREALRRKDKKRKQKEKKKLSRLLEKNHVSTGGDPWKTSSMEMMMEDEEIEIEYVSESVDENEIPPDMLAVFSRFAKAEELMVTAEEETEAEQEHADKENETNQQTTTDIFAALEAEEAEEEAKKATEKKISNRLRKKLVRPSVADLKQRSVRPEVVEVHDVTSSDPDLLVYLKAVRNSVPVPRHWSHKSKYLQRRRGMEKKPFVLPEFIQATGIAKVRESYREAEQNKSLKQKARERIRPKTKRMDVDWSLLRDAFFLNQTKPKMTAHGDLYYDGKEHESVFDKNAPGILSAELKEALGMPDGAPPPWLINMQRYGPPPSYPRMKIPGVNAPIPPGASYGFHAGGWGRPPIDDQGNPLYGGDLFGTADEQVEPTISSEYWAALTHAEVEGSSDEEDMDEDMHMAEMGDNDLSGTQSVLAPTPFGDGTLSVTTTGTASTVGFETPEIIDLRKRRDDEPPAPLYQVLQQRESSVGAALMGSSHKYVLPTSADEVQVSIISEDIDNMDEALIRQKFEDQMEMERALRAQEDTRSVVVEELAKRDRKRIREQDMKSKKKQKTDFKF